MGKQDERTIRFVTTDKRLDTDAVARILARRVTGGDYDGYIRQAMEDAKLDKGAEKCGTTEKK